VSAVSNESLSGEELSALRELLAEREIARVIHRLARASDRGDTALAATCYHDDATEDHGGFVGPAAEFVTRTGQIQFAETPHIPVMWHAVTNISIELDGDRAFVESLVLVWQRLVKDEVEFDIPVAGRYLDEFAQRGGEWRIASRVLVFDVSRVALPSPSYWDVFDKPQDTLRLGSRSGRDLSYQLLERFRAGLPITP
jgi:hypothetical protein